MNTKKIFNVLICHFIIFIGALTLSRADVANALAKSWMSNVDDNVKLCSLNIPGTHDSGTTRTTIFTSAVASCQDNSISEQLEEGIRYLDIRIDSDLLVNHSGVSCYKSTFYRLYLNDVLDYVSDFLKNNPTETVIIQLKEEGSGKGSFSNKVNSLLKTYKNIYSNGESSPSDITLGKLRGKIVIFNRSGYINNSYAYRGWGDDCVFCELDLGNSTAVLQDKYNDHKADEKMDHIKYFYNKVWKDYSSDNVFYINFTSCIGPYCPKLIAKSINTSFETFVKDNESKKFGIVLMDNPESSLINTIYSLNYEETPISIESLIKKIKDMKKIFPFGVGGDETSQT